jgi:hypothetical protein
MNGLCVYLRENESLFISATEFFLIVLKQMLEYLTFFSPTGVQ